MVILCEFHLNKTNIGLITALGLYFWVEGSGDFAELKLGYQLNFLFCCQRSECNFTLCLVIYLWFREEKFLEVSRAYL